MDAPKDQQKSRIVVKGLKPGSEAEALQLRQPRLQEGVQVISVEGYNIEGMSGSQAIKFLGEKKRETVYEQNPFRVLFRDVAKSK